MHGSDRPTFTALCSLGGSHPRLLHSPPRGPPGAWRMLAPTCLTPVAVQHHSLLNPAAPPARGPTWRMAYERACSSGGQPPMVTASERHEASGGVRPWTQRLPVAYSITRTRACPGPRGQLCVILLNQFRSSVPQTSRAAAWGGVDIRGAGLTLIMRPQVAANVSSGQLDQVRSRSGQVRRRHRQSQGASHCLADPMAWCGWSRLTQGGRVVGDHCQALRLLQAWGGAGRRGAGEAR